MKIQKISKDELYGLKDKYIFHGSHALFNECKPHQAQCDTKRQENEQFAIYGSDNIDFAVLFAFQKLPREHYSWRADCDDKGNFYGVLLDGTYIADDDLGYIYCFDKSDFTPTTQGGNQYICKKQLFPQMIIKVDYRDFKYLFKHI